MQRMMARTPHLTQQRRIFAALAAWLCVLVVSGLAPWLRVQAAAHVPHSAAPVMERVCSGSSQAQWVPSPFAEQPEQVTHDDSSHHLLACALCLPVLALLGIPPVWQASPPPLGPDLTCDTAQCDIAVAVLPPVRGPPWLLVIV